jgi:integrase
MDSIHFESVCAVARTISLHELRETYLRYNAPSDKSDLNSMNKVFELLWQFQPAADTANFGAKELRRFQDFLALRYKRNYVNKLINFVRSVFNWGVIEELVTSHAAYALKIVPPVKHGKAKDSEPRADVPVEHIESALRHLPEMPADMIRLLYLTAMRPSEVCRMTAGEINVAIDTVNWFYAPHKHKTAHKGNHRTVWLGKAEQAILQKYIAPADPPDKPLFQNTKGNPATSNWLGKLLKKTIDKEKLPKFTLYQIRHRAGTDISSKHGRDCARAVLGHSSIHTTRIYDHDDVQKARRVVNSRNEQYKTAESLKARPILTIYRGEEV